MPARWRSYWYHRRRDKVLDRQIVAAPSGRDMSRRRRRRTGRSSVRTSPRRMPRRLRPPARRAPGQAPAVERAATAGFGHHREIRCRARDVERGAGVARLCRPGELAVEASMIRIRTPWPTMRLTRGCGLGPVIGSNTAGWIPANPSSQASMSPFGPAPAITTSIISPAFEWCAGLARADRSRRPVPTRRRVRRRRRRSPAVRCRGRPDRRGEVRGDVALVVLLRFITRQSIEERGDVVDGQGRFFGDRPQGALVGPHQRLQRRAVQRDVGGSTARPTVGIWK